MNLIIDVGNSYIKLAVFKEDEIIETETVTYKMFIDAINKFQKTHTKIDHAIIASVGRLEDDVLKKLKKSVNLFILDHTSKLPFKNKYTTPTTLGIDRIALVCGAVSQFSNQNTLIIDAGTCITFDFIDAKNHYYGGAISPGIIMRYKALNTFTANLPLLEKIFPEQLIGDSTNNAIHSGVINGVLNEIDGVIDLYKQEYRDLTVILTGGDAKFLSKQLKSGIFANSNFLLEGLNYVLHFNLNE